MTRFLLLFLICLVCFNITAQVDTLDLTEIVVTENRLSLPFSEYSNSIQIITRDQIRNAPVQSISELLQNQYGLDIRRRGIHGVQSDVSIRGSTFDQVLILINGVKFSDPQTGHHALNIPIPLEQIQRVEIIKGPAARRYGQNAFAGAINIITDTDQISNQIHLRGGQNATGRVSANVTLPGQKLKHLLSFAKSFSEGYRYNTDYQIDQYFYQNQYESDGNTYGILAGYVERRFGANGFYASPDFQDQYEEIQTSLVAVQSQHQIDNLIIKPRIYWRRNQDKYIFVRNNPSVYRNLHITHMVGGEINASQQNKFGMTGAGIEWRRESIQSNNLGDHFRNIFSVYAEHRFEWLNKRLDITPGFLMTNFSDFGLHIFPGIDVGLDLNEAFKLYGNYGYTFRVPTFTDLYYEDPANEGNQDLLPEDAITYEVGMKYYNGRMNAVLTFFQRNGRDLIDWSKNDSSDRWKPSNLSQVSFSGIELSWSYTSKRKDCYRLGYTFLEGGIKESDVFQSRYALENLRHQLTGSATALIIGNLWGDVHINYLDRIILPNYILVHVKLSYQAPSFTPYIQIENLLDTKYTETNLVPMPGRWIKAGVTFDLNVFK